MDIKTYRKAKKLSQEELGKRIGVSRNAIARYENGEMTPKTDKLILLSKVLEHDFFEDVVSNQLDKKVSFSEQRTITGIKEKLDNAVRDSLLFPHSMLFSSCFEQMGIEASYETSDYNRYWTFKIDDAVSEPINEKEVETLFSRFFEHMKIDFEAFIKEHDNNVRETEEETK